MKSPDPIDKEILKLLKEDGRLSFRAIAYKMGMEGSTIRKRVGRLVENGVIERFTIDVNSEEPTGEVTAFISVFPYRRYSEEIKKRLIDFEEVGESHSLEGRCGMLLKASFHNMRRFKDFVKQIKGNPGVASVRWCVVEERLT